MRRLAQNRQRRLGRGRVQFGPVHGIAVLRLGARIGVRQQRQGAGQEAVGSLNGDEGEVECLWG